MNKWIYFLTFYTLICTNSFSQNLDYESTKNESMSKYQRIGHIEDYLSKIQSNITNVRTSLDQKFSTGDRNILSKIQSLEVSLTTLKAQVSALSSANSKTKSQTSDGQNINASDKDKLLDQIEENTAKISALQASFLGMENTLKSIQEMLKVQKDNQ